MKNTPDEINGRVAIIDKKLSDLEDIVVELIQIWSIKRKKTERNEASIRDSWTTSGISVYMKLEFLKRKEKMGGAK